MQRVTADSSISSVWFERRERLPWSAWALALGSLAALIAAAAAYTWIRAGDPFVDTYRDLWTAEQLLAKRRLYSDVFYQYGPLPARMTALFLSLFGPGLLALKVQGLTVLLATVAVLFGLLRRFVGAAVAWGFCCLFVVAAGFGDYFGIGIHSYLLPYSCANIWLALWNLVALHALLGVAARAPLGARDAVWCVANALALATRSEMALPALFAQSLYLALVLRGRRTALPLAALALALVLVVVLVTPASLPDYWRWTFGHLSLASGQHFQFHVLGLDHLAIGTMLGSAASIVAVALVLRATSNARWLPLAVIVIGAIPVVANTRQALSGGLFLALAGLAHGVRAHWTQAADARLGAAAALVHAMTLAACVRHLLDWTPSTIGFSNFALMTLSLAVFVGAQLPTFAEAPQRSAAPSAFLVAAALVTALGMARVSREQYQKRLHPITVGGDTMLLADARTSGLFERVAQWPAWSERRSLVVFPEGWSMNAATGVPNPTSFGLFVPTELELITEARVIRSLEHHRVDTVAVLGREFPEYGFSGFGQDYGLELARYLQRKYVLAASFSDGPGMAVLVRRKD